MMLDIYRVLVVFQSQRIGFVVTYRRKVQMHLYYVHKGVQLKNETFHNSG